MGGSTIVVKSTCRPERQATGKIVPVDTDSHGPQPPANDTFRPSTVFLYFLGITMTLSGNSTTWNLGLSAGLESYIVMYVVMALAYVTFCLCISEVTSTLPFAGGAFGLARCTLGFFPAFLIGCCETIEYIASVAVQALSAADVVAMAMPSLEKYKPLLWLVYYIPTTILQCVGGVSFWLGILVLGVTELLLLLLHNFGALGQLDFDANTADDPLLPPTGGLNQALLVFPLFAWFFLGVEAINLASDDVVKPRQQIPMAQIACVATLVVVGIFTSLACVSVPMDGGMTSLLSEYSPLVNGYARAFRIDPQIAPILIMPSEYAGAYGLQWAATKLIHAMGESRLLPPWCGSTSTRFGTPYVAILLSSGLGYVTCLLVFYAPSVATYLLPLCLLFAFTSYAGQCIGYVSLRLRFPIVKQRQFRNPLGIAGATYALTVWIIGIVAVLGFQGHHGIEAAFYLALLVVLAVYYVLVAKKRQIMSEEETKILLVAHISRFNQRRKNHPSNDSKYKSRGSTTAMTALSRTQSTKTALKYKTTDCSSHDKGNSSAKA